MTIEQHLAHLIALLAPPYREAWRAYAWDRAQKLASEQPELAELPRLLTDVMRAKAISTTTRASP